MTNKYYKVGRLLLHISSSDCEVKSVETLVVTHSKITARIGQRIDYVRWSRPLMNSNMMRSVSLTVLKFVRQIYSMLK